MVCDGEGQCFRFGENVVAGIGDGALCIDVLGTAGVRDGVAGQVGEVVKIVGGCGLLDKASGVIAQFQYGKTHNM